MASMIAVLLLCSALALSANAVPAQPAAVAKPAAVVAQAVATKPVATTTTKPVVAQAQGAKTPVVATTPVTKTPAQTTPVAQAPTAAAQPNTDPAVVTLPTVRAPGRGPSPYELSCQVIKENPPFKLVNCVFLSHFAVPVCPKFTCNPFPTKNCFHTGNTGAIGNEACSYAITDDCAVPVPVYPSSSRYGFGWKITGNQTVTVGVASITKVGFKGIQCPK